MNISQFLSKKKGRELCSLPFFYDEKLVVFNLKYIPMIGMDFFTIAIILQAAKEIIMYPINVYYNTIPAYMKPKSKFYTFSVPNMDTIISMLPFLLFGMLILTAFFATYISYQRVLFAPDMGSSHPLSWTGATT